MASGQELEDIMNALLANCELVVVVLLTVCFAILLEPLLFMGVLLLMKRGVNRRRRLGHDRVLAELQLATDHVKRSTRVSNLG